MRNINVLLMGTLLAGFILAVGCDRGPVIEPPLKVRNVKTYVHPWDSDNSLGNSNYGNAQTEVKITLVSNKPGFFFNLAVGPTYGAVAPEAPYSWGDTVASDEYTLVLTYQPQEDRHVSDTFKVYFKAPDGTEDTATVMVDINMLPVIDPDQFWDFAGSNMYYNGSFTASDPDGDPLSYYVTGLTKGAIKDVNHSTGDFLYYPEEPYQIQGVDVFKAWVKDGFVTGVSSKVWAYMGVNDRPPEGVTATFYVYEDKDAILKLEANDPDGDTHFIFFLTGSPTIAGNTCTVIDKYEGTFLYTDVNGNPVPGDPPAYHPDEISFQVSDGVKMSDEEDVDIQIVWDYHFCDYEDWYNWLAPERFEFVPIVNGTFQQGLIHLGAEGAVAEYEDLQEFDQVHNIYPYYSILPIPYSTSLLQARDNEHPMHPVMFTPGEDGYAFWITRCEITNHQFAEFLSDPDVNAAIGETVFKPVYADYDDTNHPAWLPYYGHRKPLYFLSGYHDINRKGSKIVYSSKWDYYEVEDQTFAQHPVLNVTWYGAQSWCKWMEHRNFNADYDYEYRLPTEAEWEYTAHGLPPGTWPYLFQPHPWNIIQTDWGNVYCPVGGFTRYDPPYLKYNVIFADIIIDGEDLEWHWVVPPGDPPSFPERVIGTAPVGFLGTGIALTSLSEPAPGPLYDMIGNAWEYCWEEYDDDYYQKIVNHYGGDGLAIIEPPDPNLSWTWPDWTEAWKWDAILPQNVENMDPVIIRGGGWGGDAYDKVDSHPPFDLGRGLTVEGFWLSGRCEMWRTTDRCEMPIHADQAYNKIGFRAVRRIHSAP